VLPKGAILLDSLRVWNLDRIVPAIFMIESVPLTSERAFLNFCDGKKHFLDVIFTTPTTFTHIEIQCALSCRPVRLEFPRLGQNTDMTKLDPTDDVQIVAGPEIPLIKRLDLIAVMAYNKMFQVTNVQLWNENQRRLLGWDVSARVIQPQELYSLLPRRRVLKQQTTFVPHENYEAGGDRT
jgi:hypothetical protein